MFADLILYFCIIGISGIYFLVVHIMYFRVKCVRNVNTTVGTISLLCSLAAGITGWTFFSLQFSSANSAVLACVAAPLTFLGFSGVYALLGPVSGDRSISAHMVIHFLRSPKGVLSFEQLETVFPSKRVFEKRIEECLELGILSKENDSLVLTDKGKKIAKFFQSLIKILNIKENF